MKRYAEEGILSRIAGISRECHHSPVEYSVRDKPVGKRIGLLLWSLP
jgi:hypothetical protein